MRFIPFLMLLLLAPVAAVAGQSNRSFYTSLEEKQCRTIKSANSETGDYEARCRGTAGYTLLVSEGDLRQNIIVVTPQGAKHSLDLWDVISGGFSSLGPPPNLSETTVRIYSHNILTDLHSNSFRR